MSLPRSSLTSLTALLAMSASIAWAASPGAGSGLKPGLWDVRLVKQVLDGRDVSSQAATSLAQAQQMLASLPPVQRARLEAMLHQAGVSEGSNGSFHICVSPAMARRELPFLDPQGRCQPVLRSRSGHAISFRFQCTTNGTAVTGNGRAVVSAERVDTHTDVTSRGPDGTTHLMQNESEMRYLSADCGVLKPPA